MADDNKDLVRLRQIFSANLNYYMELTKKSRDDICRALNIPYMTVSDWCRGFKYLYLSIRFVLLPLFYICGSTPALIACSALLPYRPALAAYFL